MKELSVLDQHIKCSPCLLSIMVMLAPIRFCCFSSKNYSTNNPEWFPVIFKMIKNLLWDLCGHMTYPYIFWNFTREGCYLKWIIANTVDLAMERWTVNDHKWATLIRLWVSAVLPSVGLRIWFVHSEFSDWFYVQGMSLRTAAGVRMWCGCSLMVCFCCN